MAWTNNFYSLVKDTEANIARAKTKLSGISDKALTSKGRPYTDFISPNKLRASKLISIENNSHYSDSNSFDDNLNLSMTSTQERQIRKMKEQIDSQNRTMEKLHKLIKSLDQERDYYKQQISFLKEQIDLLTEKIDSNLSLTSNDWKMTKIKNEVMHEIDKMKTILQKYTQEVKRPSVSRNENSVYNFDQIRDELNLMNKRIDRIENGQLTGYTKSPHGLEKKSTSTHSKNLHRFLSLTYPDANATELPKIRPMRQTMGKISSEYIDDDADSSLSDLSSVLSSTDEDLDDCYRKSKPSFKKGRGKFKSLPRVKLDLELSDLDLSDEENLSLDTDYLDVKI